MPRVPALVAFGLAALLVAISSCAPAAEGPCTFQGKGLRIGERVPAGDGCNECTCLSSGEVSCTEFTCTGGGGGGGAGGGDGGPGEDDAGSPDEPDAGGDDRPPPDCEDADGDGYYPCDDPHYPEWPEALDCDDSRWFVQPGAYEFPDNNIDDNCNGETDEVVPCGCTHSGPNATAEELISAMDLCGDTIVSMQRSGDPQQFGVFRDYFTDIVPETGDCLAVISTGIVGATDIELGGESFCDCGSFSEGCFDDPDPENPGEDVCDLAQLRLTLSPPPNAKGIEFRFMFLTSEWPEFLCTQFNDTFYTLYESQAVNGGERANISFDAQQRQITVNVGFFEAPRDWTTPLDHTPFGATDSGASCTSLPVDGCTLPDYCNGNQDLGYIGSGTGWLVTRAPFEPGEETIEVIFSIHDEGDSLYDSIVVLDSFRWVPYRPVVQTTKD